MLKLKLILALLAAALLATGCKPDAGTIDNWLQVPPGGVAR